MGKLTKVEISFLGWLRDQGGKCALNWNDEFSKYYRLVNAGFIDVQLPDRFNPAVVTFKLTESGQEILRAVERTQPAPDRGVEHGRSGSELLFCPGLFRP
jgi:hypothetical protein